MNSPSSDDIRKLQHLREILSDLVSFWEAVEGQEVDDRLLREFAWAVEEAYEEVAYLLVTKSGQEADGGAEEQKD
jgi:hypothetical protein